MALLSSEEFHELAECSNELALDRDKAGPILYASRYSLDILRAKQTQMIEIFSETLEIKRELDRDEQERSYFARKDGKKLTKRDLDIIAELTMLNNAIKSSEESPKLSGK